jgi:hypothetical protein
LGRVSCAEHGLQSGPLCCEHVLGALARQAQVPADVAVEFSVDLPGDGDDLGVLPCIVCPECAAMFELNAGQMLPGELLDEEGKLPSVAPSCDKCVTAWRDRARN